MTGLVIPLFKKGRRVSLNLFDNSRIILIFAHKIKQQQI